MKGQTCLFLILLASSFYVNARPAADGDFSDSLRARLGDTVSEIEWLLHQLVNILSDMVDGIEMEPNLLQNYHFRQILIQVIKRIDYILEHFENVGTAVLTPSVIYELQRIDCIRIRLANYISQTKKFDDSQCRPGSGSNKPGHPANSDQVVPLLTQIVSILVKVTQQLDHISRMKEQIISSTTQAPFPWMSTTAYPLWTKPASTINWEDLISQFVSSKPVTIPNTSNGMVTPANGVSSTANWGDLISQVMDGMGGTLTPTVTSAPMVTVPSTGTTAWEDAMNDLIGEWSGTLSTSAPSNGDMNVQQCVDSILSIINTIQSQLPNGTTTLPSTAN